MAVENYEDENEDRGDLFEDDEVGEDLEDESEEDESGDDDDSGTDEESEEESEDDEEDEEQDIPPKAKEPRIPKSRLDEVAAQRDEFKDRSLWLEEQIEKLIAKEAKSDKKDVADVPKVSYDFDTAEEEYANLLISGEVAAASKLRATINKARQEELMELVSSITEKATTKVKTESSLEKEAERFEIAISSMERKFPFLDSKSKSYNEEAVETVNALLAGYIASGKLTKSEALAKAVEKAVPLYTKPEKEKLGSTRTKDAGKKAADAASRQPAKVKTTSTKNNDLQAVNVSKMSERDFNKLTEKEKRTLRGD